MCSNKLKRFAEYRRCSELTQSRGRGIDKLDKKRGASKNKPGGEGRDQTYNCATGHFISGIVNGFLHFYEVYKHLSHLHMVESKCLKLLRVG